MSQNNEKRIHLVKVQVVRDQYRITIPKEIAEFWSIQRGTHLFIRNDPDKKVIEIIPVETDKLWKTIQGKKAREKFLKD